MSASHVRWGGSLTVRPSGVSVAAATPFARASEPVKRGKIRGWSRKSAARHVKWLQSVQADRLTGCGYSVTLTVRTLPVDAPAWALMRRQWLNAVRAVLPLVRGHWVTEWQRRGVPHLHAALYFDRELTARERLLVLKLWAGLGGAGTVCGAAPGAQKIDAIYSGTGWARYLAKHSARSAGHYQRSGMPPGWESSGRLWGHFGEWPTASNKYVLNPAAFVTFRRLVRSWAISQARSEIAVSPRPNWKRLTFVRRMLAGSSPERAAVRGITEWVPEAVVVRMLQHIAVMPGCIVADDWYGLLSPRSAAAARDRAVAREAAGQRLRGSYAV